MICDYTVIKNIMYPGFAGNRKRRVPLQSRLLCFFVFLFLLQIFHAESRNSCFVEECFCLGIVICLDGDGSTLTVK